MQQSNDTMSEEKINERWNIFLGADVQNGVCWVMSYLIKEDGQYYIQHSHTTYGGHPWGSSSACTRRAAFEDDASEIIGRIIKADRQGTLLELVRQENLLVFDSAYDDFGSIETLRIPEVLKYRLMDDLSDGTKNSQEQLAKEAKTGKCFYIYSNTHTKPDRFLSKRVALFRTNANYVIKYNVETFFGVGHTFYEYPQAFYAIISNEEAEKIITDTAKEESLNLKYKAQRIGTLKTDCAEIVEYGVGVHQNQTVDRLCFTKGQYVLHRLETRYCFYLGRQTVRSHTCVTETVWCLKANTIDEISVHNYESLRSNTPVFRDSYIIDKE